MDLRWMSQGGLLIDGNGDLAGHTGGQDQNTRSRSSLRPLAEFRIRSRALSHTARQLARIELHAGVPPGRFPGRH